MAWAEESPKEPRVFPYKMSDPILSLRLQIAPKKVSFKNETA